MTSTTDIRDTFFQECDDLLEQLNDGLLQISALPEAGSVDAETVNAIFRAVHSIKGGAAAFRLEALVHFSHCFENTLDALRAGRLSLTVALAALLQRAADHLADLVRAARDGRSLGQDAGADLVSKLADSIGHHTTAPVSPQNEMDFTPLALSFEFEAPLRTWRINFFPNFGLLDSGNDPVHIFRELTSLGATTAIANLERLPVLSALDPDELLLDWQIDLETTASAEEIAQVFEFVGGLSRLEIVELNQVVDLPLLPDAVPNNQEPEHPPQNALSAQSSTPRVNLRVDTDHVDRLINLASELVINQAVLNRLMAEVGVSGRPDLASALSDLRNLCRELQEGVMAIRAQPVKPMFQRMARIVRDASDLAQKKVEFQTFGDSTEVDKTVIEQLVDPLTHMIRNAIDHGLETPEARRNAGKPEVGQVRLSAAHRSGRVVIEVSDDGAGINRPKVLNIAKSKGLLPQDAVLAEAEIDALLFLPGFSTASSVTCLSGRGVGLDVVKSAIRKLGGRLNVSSEPGRGTTMSISLPLTLAVLDGMVIEVAEQTMVIPIPGILQTLQPEPTEIEALGASGSGALGQVVRVHDRIIPIVDLGRLLGFREDAILPEKTVLVVVETEAGATCALAVDAILDQQQVVIKGLEANYGRVPFISAATILGTGRIALILDPDDIVGFVATPQSAPVLQVEEAP